MAKKKGKGNRWASQAAVQALLRYGPQESALAELQRQAEGTYRTSIAQARGTGDMSVAQIQQAVPQTQAIFDRSARERDLGNLLRGPTTTTAAAGSPADVLARGSGIMQAREITNGASARARALNALTDRKVAARSGVQYATENARQQFVSDLGKVFQQKVDLAGQKGAYSSLTAQQLQDAADERAQALAIAEGQMSQSERNSLRSSGTDPDTGLPTTDAQISADKTKNKNRGKVSGTGAPLLSPDKHLSTRSTLSSAASEAAKQFAGGIPRRLAGQVLMEGVPSSTVPNAETGGMTNMPGRKAYDELMTRAALDMAYANHISPKTQKMLSEAGYSIKRLGLTTKAQWRKAGSPRPKRPAKPTLANSRASGTADVG